jgi:hypothetical protein
MGYRPVTDMVAQAWLSSLPGLSAGMVGATLPQGDSWASTGFVQVTVVTGAVDPYTGLRAPQVQVDCWARKPESAKPPWRQANQLAELVVAATVNGTGQQTILDLGVHYDAARVLSVRALGEPRRVVDPDGSYARYSVDLGVTWVRAETGAM